LRQKTQRLIAILLVGTALFTVLYRDGLILDHLGLHLDNPFTRTVIVPETYSDADRNENGIADPLDIVAAARAEVRQKTKYRSKYYAGGYPPAGEGVCTDVVWRGLLGASIRLKDLMDADIAANDPFYPRVNGTPDPNIDFRRVPNQDAFFRRFAESLTTELIPGDIGNLLQWQPGDIVVFLDGCQHIGIVSDRRAKDGTPYLIHNSPPFAAETKLKSVTAPISAHYRWNY
jgi:uncharacterized protein YijF (DUF1287 family)